jgi:hypothetical protein
VPKFGRRQSRRLSTVVAQQSSHPFAPNDWPAASKICGTSGDQGVVQALMVAFLMIVNPIFRNCSTEMPLLWVVSKLVTARRRSFQGSRSSWLTQGQSW